MKAEGPEGKGVAVRQEEVNPGLVNRGRGPFTSEILVPILTTDQMRKTVHQSVTMPQSVTMHPQHFPMSTTLIFSNLITTASRNLS